MTQNMTTCVYVCVRVCTYVSPWLGYRYTLLAMMSGMLSAYCDCDVNPYYMGSCEIDENGVAIDVAGSKTDSRNAADDVLSAIDSNSSNPDIGMVRSRTAGLVYGIS